MSFVQRRRFLWILFLAGLALLAIAANATTLSRVRFEELANQATAISRRVLCLPGERNFLYFPRVEPESLSVFSGFSFFCCCVEGALLLPCFFDLLGCLAEASAACIHESRACRRFARARKPTYFSGRAKANRFACWDGRKERFES